MRLRTTLPMHLCLLLPLLWSFAVSAQPPQRDYTAEVVLETDSAEARTAALREALAQVLTRVAGQPVPDITLDAADRWVQHFGVARGAEGERLLRAGFDPGSIDQALRDRGYPVWGAFAGDRQSWRLHIEGIDAPADLAKLYSALQLPSAEDLQVEALKGQSVSLRITTSSGVMMLEQALAQAGAVRLLDRGSDGVLRYQMR